ncbi:MAG: hypothetical protein D6800_13965, partial [Candidatus Zixiibacteriota bacterium]
LLGIVMVLYTVGRFFGAAITGGHWSFTHWQALPGWYPYFWIVIVVLLAIIVWRFGDTFGRWLNSSRRQLGALVILFLLLIVFHLDSFLFSAGNLRVAQIAQADKIFIPWYEAGTIVVVSAIYHLFSVFGLKANTASVWAWRVLAYGCTLLSLWAVARFAKRITDDPLKRVWLFVIGFLGPQTLLYLGFIGVEPVVLPVTLWFGYFVFALSKEHSVKSLMAVWLVVIIGAVMHVTLLYLLPAAVFVTMAVLQRGNLGRLAALIMGILVLGGMILFVYHEAAGSLRLSAQLLFPHGKAPFTDYGIFSWRHLGDILGLFFLTAPLVLVIKYVALRDWSDWLTSTTGMA